MLDQLGREGVALEKRGVVLRRVSGEVLGVLMLLPGPDAVSLLPHCAGNVGVPADDRAAFGNGQQPGESGGGAGAGAPADRRRHLHCGEAFAPGAHRPVPDAGAQCGTGGRCVPAKGNAPGGFAAALMAAALTIGLVEALLCCALFGWLMRFVPVRRIRAVGQFVAMAPLLLIWGAGPLTRQAKRVFRVAGPPREHTGRAGDGGPCGSRSRRWWREQ